MMITPLRLVVASVVLVAATACANSSNGGASEEQFIDGGTMTIAIVSDPGNLDPHGSVGGDNVTVADFLYDRPVTVDRENQIQPGIVTDWEVAGAVYTLTVREGVTCSDGSPMDAQTISDNIAYVSDPENQSPFADVAVPIGTVSEADNESGTVSVTLPAPAPFFIENLRYLFLVCQAGLADRDSLATASNGSGPFVLSDVVPGESITMTVREGYEWGPDDAATTAAGTPAEVVFRVVTNETTAANLVLNGQVNIAGVQGSDRARLEAAGLESTGSPGVFGTIFYNQSEGLATADTAVRRALTMGLDLTELAKVETAGEGSRATGLMSEPKICPGNTIEGHLPAYDPEAAQALLEEAGWVADADGIRAKDGSPLTVSLLYASGLATGTAVAEYISAQWGALGVDVELNQQSGEQVNTIILGGAGAWDAVIATISATNPATFVPFLSGAVPPEGTNFGQIDNAEYEEFVSEASMEIGTDSCANWNAAESALFESADVVPYSEQLAPLWANGATFGDEIGIVPTSVKLIAD